MAGGGGVVTRFPLGLGGASGPRTFAQMIQSAGQAAALELCLDAADAACFGGTGQTLFDTSGAGNDFMRGNSTNANATDPSFVGVAGDLSENTWLQFDGGDILTATAGVTFCDGWHHDGAAFTVLALVRLPGGIARLPYIFCTGGTEFVTLGYVGSGAGSQWRSASLSVVKNAITTVLSLRTANNFVTEGAWILLAYVVDEVSAAFRVFCNGAWSEIAGATYAAPAAGTPSAAPTIGGNAGASSSYTFGTATRLAALAAWNRALSQADVEAVYAQARRRWSTLPSM